MYMIDAVEERFESSLPDSPQEKLSEYILIHLRTVPEMTLTDMSLAADVSKGYISKYVSSLTAEGTYASFQNALHQEFGYSCPDRQKIVEEAVRFEHQYHEASRLADRDIAETVKYIETADKVWIIGARGYRGAFIHLIRALWANGKKARFVSGAFLNACPEIISCIKPEDTVIIISAADSPERYRLKTAPTLDVLRQLSMQNCQVIYFGEKTGGSGKIKVFPAGKDNGLFTELTTVLILGVRLTRKYIQNRIK